MYANICTGWVLDFVCMTPTFPESRMLSFLNINALFLSMDAFGMLIKDANIIVIPRLIPNIGFLKSSETWIETSKQFESFYLWDGM